MAKKKTSSKPNVKNILERLKKKLLEPQMLIILGVILVLLIASYFIFGIEFTVVISIGILIILGIARLLDSKSFTRLWY